MELAVAGERLQAERYGAVGDEAGWNNPDGITIVGANGNSVVPEHWDVVRRRLSLEAQQRGMDVSLVTIRDGNYYDQASHTAAVTEAVLAVDERVPDGHRIWIAGWSRGGISAVQAAGSHGQLAESGVVDGVLTMGTPTVPMESVKVEGQPVATSSGVPSISPLQVFSPDALNELATQVDEFNLKLSVVGEAVRRIVRDREAVAGEAAEVEATGISGELVGLSHMPGVQVVTVFYDGDVVVPAERHINGLLEVAVEADVEPVELGDKADFAAERRFGGKVLRLAGTHFRPLVDPDTRKVMLDSVAEAA